MNLLRKHLDAKLWLKTLKKVASMDNQVGTSFQPKQKKRKKRIKKENPKTKRF